MLDMSESKMVLAEKELNTASGKVCAEICAELARNSFAAGTKLKSIQKIAKQYNVSYLTAQKAIKEMQKVGIVESRRGDGTYVTEESRKFLKSFLEQQNNSEKNGIKITEKTYSIGLVLPYWMEMTNEGALAFHRLTQSFVGEIDKHNWRVEIINNAYQEAARPDFVDKLVQKKLDGVYWLAPQPEHRMNLMRLVDKGMHVVTTGRNFSDIPLAAVFVDIDDMARKIADFCIENDRKNIVVLCGILDGELKDENSARFVNELCKALSASEIELNDDHIGQVAIFTPDNKILTQLTFSFLEKHPQADTIISYHEEFFPMIEELDKKGFWEKPEGMKIIDVNAEFGFNKTQVGRIPVTRILMPLEDLGRASAIDFEKKWLGASRDLIDLRVSLDMTESK